MVVSELSKRYCYKVYHQIESHQVLKSIEAGEGKWWCLESEELVQVEKEGSINTARRTEAQISHKKSVRRKARERGV